ncbi:hypothetical protein Sbal625DRAFT_4141 [Shewanella baltica OS625]|uniref:hypothetical protein n=1 Tax=Shewanella baltica TaxID=62322 RepID=UPI000230DD51|nr:hypothetical protein [Shewanella baltica]EHC04181.1 hypothetical protein Sbal625DRAFT_4141 [Shewanella baltica OS625]
MTHSITTPASHTKPFSEQASLQATSRLSKDDISNSEKREINSFPVKVKNFGNDVLCHSLAELSNLLRKDYKGMHVSIVDSLPSGIMSLMFVSVNTDGMLFDTYTHKAISLFMKEAK